MEMLEKLISDWPIQAWDFKSILSQHICKHNSRPSGMSYYCDIRTFQFLMHEYPAHGCKLLATVAPDNACLPEKCFDGKVGIGQSPRVR